MPLISCPECQTEVSDTALHCTKCGVQLRKLTRSIFGKLVKWSFILFNLLMAAWLVGGTRAATKGYEAMSSAEQAGTAIGTGIGVVLILTIWVVGDIILGIFTLLTRPKG